MHTLRLGNVEGNNMLSRSENRIFTQIDAIYIVLFFASFASSMLGIVFMLLLVFYLTRGAEGGVTSRSSFFYG